MEYEYEGKTEREAIEKAASDLDLERDQFDVEILETQKGTLFKKGFVRIRVTTATTPNASTKEDLSAQSPEQVARTSNRGSAGRGRGEEYGSAERKGRGYSDAGDGGDVAGERSDGGMGHTILADPKVQDGFEKNVADFVSGMIQKMGYEATLSALFREPNKVGFRIDSPDCAVLIGRKGSTLDALQLLANVYAGRLGHEEMRIILDCQNYRIHREETLVRMAYNTADRVAATRRSVLLEPMNPFERRIIHTTLGDVPNITTKSEGNGVYKRVRIMYRGVR